ncbi:MAG: ATP-binding protein [Aminivibrio sp.]|jgi:signal transduction histidine kinase/CheY-like chemotaxis protein/HPt (histidine-containing phosphotransfer) domain-containing protein
MAAENYRTMKERLDTLSGERETAKRLLESAVDSLGFAVVVDEDFSQYSLFEECARKVRTFIAFKALAFLVFSPDGLDFSLSYIDPSGDEGFFEEEIGPLIDDRTFAWAVDRNRPVIVTARDGSGQILLHSMTTQNRTMGMFIGLLGEDEVHILDLSFAFLTVVLSSVAGLLQNAELYSVIRDLNSELTKKIERLEESEQSLAEAMRARDIFLANVSHEIRTPLNGILGMTSLLGDTSLDGRQKELLKILGDESSSLLRLINDLLDFSRIEAGKLTFEDAPFRFLEFWDGIADGFRPRARQKNLRFKMELAGEPPETVSGDSLRIKQVFGNIVGNALKFTSRGEVSVMGKILPGEEGHVILKVDVRDSGIGISKEQADRLFKPFVQGDSSTTRKYGGTGLGLVISRRLLEAMEGSISIEHSGGPGAHFRFSLPLKVLEDAPPREEKPAADSLEFPSGYSVLVAEDNDTSRLVAVSMLKKLGVPVVETARDGAEAVEKLSVSGYDLVLMDIQMPVMDGIEAVTIIRDSSSSVLDHNIPVAAMTANILPADREKYLNAGMTDYISKPVLPGELAALFGRIMKSGPRKTEARRGQDTAVFRRDLLLQRLGDDEVLCDMAVSLFIDDSKKIIGELADLLGSGDLEEARMKGHTLKGAAANVEAVEIRDKAAAIEEAVQRGEISRALSLSEKLSAARDRFAEAAIAAAADLSAPSGKDDPS